MIKAACKTITGKEAGMEEACEAMSGKQSVNSDSDVYLPLVTGGGDGAVVTYLGLDKSAVPAEPVTDLSICSKDWETSALPAPIKMEIAVPTNNWDPSQPLVAHGPSGPIRVRLPQDAVPGTSMICKLAPKPEYRIRVPPGAKPGWVIRFQKQNGEEVAVGVPPNAQPGETFDVTPPALMVRVPDNAKPGDYVAFKQETVRQNGTRIVEVFRARVPDHCVPWDHFSALLPPPPGPTRPE